MTLWDQLSAICFVTPVAIAATLAHRAHARVGGHAVGIAVGLVIAGGSVWGMHRAAGVTMSRIADLPEPRQNRYSVVLYAGVIVWIAFTAFVTGEIASAFLHL
jgi:hypothetical protein